jgi:hypothetical protein
MVDSENGSTGVVSMKTSSPGAPVPLTSSVA